MAPFTAATLKNSALVVLSVLTSYLAYDCLSKQTQEGKSTAKMAELKVGDSFPEGVVFSYIPYTEEKGDITACGIPINYDASKGQALLLSSHLQSHSASPLVILGLAEDYPTMHLSPSTQELESR